MVSSSINMVTKTTKPFLIQRRECQIEFPEGHEFEGIEIRARLDVELNMLLEFQAMSEEGSSEMSRTVFTKFGDDVLLEWNVHDEDGKRVKADGAGFLTLPMAMAQAVITSWIEEAAKVGEA